MRQHHPSQCSWHWREVAYGDASTQLYRRPPSRARDAGGISSSSSSAAAAAAAAFYLPSPLTSLSWNSISIKLWKLEPEIRQPIEREKSGGFCLAFLRPALGTVC